MQTVDFFFYGTLLDAAVREIVLGPIQEELTYDPAVLADWRRCPVGRGEFPALLAERGATVDGVIANAVPLEAAARVSYFEGDGYDYDVTLAPVRTIADDQREAWVYLPTSALAVTMGRWTVEEWSRRWRQSFIVSARHTMQQMTDTQMVRYRKAWEAHVI